MEKVPRLGRGDASHIFPDRIIFFVAFRRAFARSRGVNNMDLLGKSDFLGCRKSRNWTSGVRCSESATSVFSPMGYRSKELWKKDGFSMK